MKPQLLLLASLTLTGISFSLGKNALISQQTQVLSKISDASPLLQKADTKPPHEYKIHWSQVKHVNGQQFTINNIEEPIAASLKDAETDEEKDQREKDYQKSLETLKPSGGTFMVFASIYDHKTTLVTLNHEGERYEIWSNVDWNHLIRVNLRAGGLQP